MLISNVTDKSGIIIRRSVASERSDIELDRVSDSARPEGSHTMALVSGPGFKEDIHGER